MKDGDTPMDKPLIIHRFVPAKGSTTSDSQLSSGSCTAETDNLAAIMKNSVVVFDNPLTPATGSAEIAISDSEEKF